MSKVDVNNLMIGNYININKSITAINQDSVIAGNSEILCKDIIPIEITEDWLEYLNIRRLGDFYYTGNFELMIRKVSDPIYYVYLHIEEVGSTYFLKTVMFVHELQNIVNLLT